MKHLITGCAGFIGSNYSRYLLEKYPEDTIVGVDCLTYAANLTALELLKTSDRFKFYCVNICDREGMREIMKLEHPDVIVNFAGESHVDRSINDSSPFIMTNVVGTGVLLDLALEFKINRFHQISTDEVYGPSASDIPFAEEALLRPSSPYSASKAAADHLALSYHRTHGLPVSISRSSNNYGRFQHVEKFIPRVIDLAKNDKNVTIYGDGMSKRDWLCVEDNCRGIDMIVRHPSSSKGEIYNISTGILTANLDLAKSILKIMGKSEALITFVEERKGHDSAYLVDTSKMQLTFDWKPQFELCSSLREIVGYYY